MTRTLNIVSLLADFSNAVQVTKNSPMCTDIVGVIFWQASLFYSMLFTFKRFNVLSFRHQKSESKQSLNCSFQTKSRNSFFFSLRPPYNALKVDVWSLGATVWEMAQTEPPFSDTQQFGDRWPPLRQPKLYSPAFHDFLRKCSDPPSSRPNPSDLLKVRSSFPTAILHLVELCPFTASFHP